MAKNELDGFVLFTTNKGSAVDNTVALVLSASNVRLTHGAVRILGNPEFINIFFDDNGKRMMIKLAQKTMANVFKVTSKSIKAGAVANHIAYLTGLQPKAGIAYRIEGHNPGSPNCLVFDLTRFSTLATNKGAAK